MIESIKSKVLQSRRRLISAAVLCLFAVALVGALLPHRHLDHSHNAACSLCAMQKALNSSASPTPLRLLEPAKAPQVVVLASCGYLAAARIVLNSRSPPFSFSH